MAIVLPGGQRELFPNVPLFDELSKGASGARLHMNEGLDGRSDEVLTGIVHRLLAA
ncbi:hypothetical protein D3C87_2159800 [compost metagenome]